MTWMPFSFGRQAAEAAAGAGSQGAVEAGVARACGGARRRQGARGRDDARGRGAFAFVQAVDEGDLLAGSSLAGGKGSRRGGSKRARGAGAPSPSRKPAAAKAPRSSAKRGGGGLLRHDFAVVLKQLVPILLVALAVFAVLMPVSTAAIPSTSVFNLDYTHDQMKFRFWAEDVSYVVVLGAALFGAVLGVRAFRFMLVKREATAVLSLPLSRAALFGTRFAACVACLVVGLGAPMVATLVVNIVALDVWAGLFWSWAYVLAGLLLTAVVACAVAAIACALSGTVAEAAAFACALLASVTVACWGLNAVMDHLLVGNAFGETLYSGTAQVAPSLLSAAAFANPLLFFAQEAADHQQFIVQHPVYEPLPGNAVLLACWLAVAVVLVALALLAVRRRKGEKAGIAGLNVAVSAVVGIVLGLAAFGLTFTVLATLNVVAAVVAAFAVLWAVSAVLFRGLLRGNTTWKRTFGVMGVESAALACVVACVATGGLGYASAVPESDEVASVQVSYTGSPSFLAAPFESATAGDGSYYFSAEYTFTDAAAVDIVRDVHQQLVSTGSQPLAENRLDFGSTVVPYDVVVRYTLADGSQLVRYYDRATYDELAELAQLDDTREALEYARAVVSGDVSMLNSEQAQQVSSSSARQAFALGDIYVADRLYSTPMLVNCDATARAQLLAALAEDVATQSAQDRYCPASACRGVVMFTQAGDTAADSFAYSLENSVIYLTDEFENTLAWFEEKGLSSYLSVPDEAAAVESMTFQRYAPYEGMNAVTNPTSAYFMGYKAATEQQFVAMMDWGTKFSTSDQAQIAELLPLCDNASYMNGGGYLVSCKLAGQAAYAYLFIPAEDAPEWLVRVAG